MKASELHQEMCSIQVWGHGISTSSVTANSAFFPEAIQTKHLPACCLEAENGALPFLLLDQFHSMKKTKSFSSPGQKDCSTNLKSVVRPGSKLETHNYKNTKPFGRRRPCEMKWLPPSFPSLRILAQSEGRAVDKRGEIGKTIGDAPRENARLDPCQPAPRRLEGGVDGQSLAA